ncbi:hypothetical protein SUGI_0093760 [Cryptomeria japonica]|uniref:mitogen-activated protein kinase kinase kinase 20 n=1 Tax=Cryptomeria japonica TaxID=3369 RepID=UPI002408D0F2|nr:mitogen-activated protein kinase kinase kinase 20 [Cryptomeria japonica]GLJ08689.1 hypothetical protein SUGI_0093760 [Cryptomeria japonica]
MRNEKETKEGEDWIRGGIIGAGASGTVSLGISKPNAHLFAVKTSSTCTSSLENEYNLLKSLDSPYVVQCLGKEYSIQNGVGVYNLFMEYMPGGSIGDLLTKFGGKLDEAVIRSYTRGILLGIQYLHRQGIVHCDIKGKNVLVGSKGVKLADLGSAKRISGKEEEGWNLRGTPLWMAPEVVNQVEQGPASDIWSLGCTVVEMATGKPPWGSSLHPLAAMYRIGFTEELPEMPQSLSPQGQDFVEKCLRRDPGQRWTSEQLLGHPFLSQEESPVIKEGLLRAPETPIRPFDLKDSESCSSDDYPCVPILKLPLTVSTAEMGACDGEEKEAYQKIPSPRDRIQQLAVGGEFERVVEKDDDWFGSPLTGQWIVVRSPKHKESITDGHVQQSSNGFLSNGISSVQPEAVCSPIADSGDCAKVPSSESQLDGLSCSRMEEQIDCAVCKAECPNHFQKDNFKSMDISNSGSWNTESIMFETDTSSKQGFTNSQISANCRLSHIMFIQNHSTKLKKNGCLSCNSRVYSFDSTFNSKLFPFHFTRLTMTSQSSWIEKQLFPNICSNFPIQT